MAIELSCPKTGDKYSYTIPILADGPSVTLRKDKNASKTKTKKLRWIFGNLGRDIFLQNEIGSNLRYHNGPLILERELKDAEHITLVLFLSISSKDYFEIK